MSASTGIEWTDRTWNPLVAFRRVGAPHVHGPKQSPFVEGKRGWFCTKISPGCVNCYAAKINMRLGTGHDYVKSNTVLVNFGLVGLEDPLKWKHPQRVFVNSMTDLFHESVPDVMIWQVFAAMAASPRHTFQVLTKRAKRMREFCTAFTVPGYEWPLPNVHLGVSVEDQERANERIGELAATPAACRFLSVEPMLGPVSVDAALSFGDETGGCVTCEFNSEFGRAQDRARFAGRGLGWWVICGGESGIGARPMKPQWVRALRDECRGARVPFFFKQWGAFAPFVQSSAAGRGRSLYEIREYEMCDGAVVRGKFKEIDDLVRVGKKRAGRMLDGREWSEFPIQPKNWVL